MAVQAFGNVDGIDAGRAIAPQLCALLRQRIIRNELPAGQKISEAEIAMAYGISRQPVREAFIRLSGEGLVEVLPQRGTRICRIGLAAVREARFIREAIEADIVTLLAERPDVASVDRLRGLLDEQRHVPADDPEAFMEADERFHRALAEAAGKAGTWARVEGLKAQMDRVRFLSVARFPMAALIDQHARIVDRIAEGDGAGAGRALRGHLREILRDLPHIVRDNPAVFAVPPDGDDDRIVTIQGGETP